MHLILYGLIQLISLFKKVRIGLINGCRLGFFAFEPDLYLQRKDQNYLDFFVVTSPISNTVLLQAWKKKITILPFSRKIFDQLAPLLRSDQLINLEIDQNYNWNEVLSCTPSPIDLDVHTKAIHQDFVSKRRLEDNNYVCFINRDSSYLKNHLADQDWSYYDYRDFSFDDFRPAIEYLSERKVPTLRMGAMIKEPLEWEKELFIDYARLFRKEALDLSLISGSLFFCGPNSGPYVLATLLRKPVAFVNLCPFLGTTGLFKEKDLFIPKHYWLKKESRLMTFREILGSNAYYFLKQEEFDEAGIEVRSNSPEEIKELVEEMYLKLKGSWKRDDGQVERLEKWRKLELEFPNHKNKIPQISERFLYRYSNLL